MGMQYPANTGGSSPSIVTSGGGNSDIQALMLQSMMANMKPADASNMQAALAAAARAAANKAYIRNSIRKLAPALTNGAATQAYLLNTPLTFNLSTALNGFCEGLIIRQTINYTLAAGTAAVYGLTPGGKFATIDTIEVRYNKSQHKIRPQIFRQLALMGALEDYTLPEAIIAGQSTPFVQSWLDTGMPISVGANSMTLEYFVPFNLLNQDDPRGLLPIMVGDTGIQVIVNTPLSLFGADPVLNSIYAVSGTGHAISAISGTMQVSAIYRDGDQWMSTAKLPFDLSSVQGTFQMQIDQALTPLVAGSPQRTKLNIQGMHAYVILLCVDGLQSNVYSNYSNMSYLEIAKDGIGGNTFWKFGTQTNLDVRDWLYLKRLDHKQDLDNGVLPIIGGPVALQGDPHIRDGEQFLDNTRNGWPDWRYGVTFNSVGAGTVLNAGVSLPCIPRIEPHVFYINPVGLVPV